MRSPLLLIVVGLATSAAAALIGDALDFGGLAWIGTLIAVMLTVSAFDRERFYGPRPPQRR
ncbi:MAG: hypothetical protein M3401_17295 [Actinomycetota bacterium]|nr:hypothetical protein [Actinomycetota bacterium]